MSSELKVNALLENTNDNGIAIDSFHFEDGIMIQSEDIGAQTIASGKSAMIIGPAKCANKLTIAGNVRVI